MSERELNRLREEIQERLDSVEPAVELLALEQPATERLRLFIDSPEGVNLGLCERVTNHLRDLLEDYALEVSSPGPQRPLTKPDHFRRFLGRRVRVKTREEIGGRRSFTGTLTEADEQHVSVDAGEGAVAIPLGSVRRSNLMPDEGEVAA